MKKTFKIIQNHLENLHAQFGTIQKSRNFVKNLEKNYSRKIRESKVVLCFLAIDNFELTRKIAEIFWKDGSW